MKRALAVQTSQNQCSPLRGMSSVVSSHLLFRVLLVAAAIFSSSVGHQGVALAEGECINEGIPCYNCDSTHDPKCGDPWNYTEYYDSGIPIEKCMGCCVKIVTYSTSKTPSGFANVTTNVRRLCTTSLQINLFLVDHVCMQESDGNGHMCFCETDLCNSAHTILPWFGNIVPSSISIRTAITSTMADTVAEDYSAEPAGNHRSSILLVAAIVLAFHSFIGNHLVNFGSSQPLNLPEGRAPQIMDRHEVHRNSNHQSVKERSHSAQCTEVSKVRHPPSDGGTESIARNRTCEKPLIIR